MTSPPRPGMRWFTAAAVLGTVHAIASLYWAVGGSWLVDTVGQWAVEWRRDSPVVVGLVLGGIGLAKLAGAWVPWADHRWALRGSLHTVIRLVSWAGGALLVLYGGVNTVAANLLLVGAFGGVDDLMATRGHAWLWDPLFAAWGGALLLGLSRRRARD